jgi:hypothetical protein
MGIFLADNLNSLGLLCVIILARILDLRLPTKTFYCLLLLVFRSARFAQDSIHSGGHERSRSGWLDHQPSERLVSQERTMVARWHLAR